MRLKDHQRVDMDTAKKRALSALSHDPLPASCVADAIWPDHQMRAQGAGAAASRILKQLERDGKAHWIARTEFRWGWVKT